jgi:hypothetical protein
LCITVITRYLSAVGPSSPYCYYFGAWHAIIVAVTLSTFILGVMKTRGQKTRGLHHVAFEAALAGAGHSGSILCVKVRMAKSVICAGGDWGSRSKAQIVVSFPEKDVVALCIISAEVSVLDPPEITAGQVRSGCFGYAACVIDHRYCDTVPTRPKDICGG